MKSSTSSLHIFEVTGFHSNNNAQRFLTNLSGRDNNRLTSITNTNGSQGYLPTSFENYSKYNFSLVTILLSTIENGMLYQEDTCPSAIKGHRL